MKFILKTISLLAIALISFSYPLLCNDQNKTTGTYSLLKSHHNSHLAFIKGQLIDKETGEALKIAFIEVTDKRIKADTNGIFSLQVLPGKYIVTGLCYPYHRVITKPAIIKSRETLTIKFYRLIDKTPLE